MEQRRTRRFTLELPLSITRSGSERVAFVGCTRNISSTGVLFIAEGEPDLGAPIEYIVTLNHQGPHSVNLRCIGKVMRAVCLDTGENRQGLNFQIAATLERYEFVRERGLATG